MTISEMHTAFKIEVDNGGSLVYPNFETLEIDLWLNKAQKKIFRDTLHGNLTNPLNINTALFKEDMLVKFSDLDIIQSVDDTLIPNGAYVTLPSDFAEVIDVRINANNSADAIYDAMRVPYTVAKKFIKTPNNTPWIDNPVYYMQDSKLTYLYDTTDANFVPGTDTVILSYYRYPLDVKYSTGTSSEMPSFMHDQIVSQAVLMALDNIESPRVQTNTNIIKESI